MASTINMDDISMILRKSQWAIITVIILPHVIVQNMVIYGEMFWNGQAHYICNKVMLLARNVDAQ